MWGIYSSRIIVNGQNENLKIRTESETIISDRGDILVWPE